MKINENRKSLKTADLIFINFQYQSINCYWFLLTIIGIIGSTMYKHLWYLQSRPLCVLSWLTVPRDQQWRDHFRYSPLYLTRYPILDCPLQCPTTHFRCLDFDDDDDDHDDDNDDDDDDNDSDDGIIA